MTDGFQLSKDQSYKGEFKKKIFLRANETYKKKLFLLGMPMKITNNQ